MVVMKGLMGCEWVHYLGPHRKNSFLSILHLLWYSLWWMAQLLWDACVPPFSTSVCALYSSMCTCMWKPEASNSWLPWSLSTLSLRQCISLKQALTDWLEWLTSELWGNTCFYPTKLGSDIYLYLYTWILLNLNSRLWAGTLPTETMGEVVYGWDVYLNAQFPGMQFPYNGEQSVWTDKWLAWGTGQEISNVCHTMR